MYQVGQIHFKTLEANANFKSAFKQSGTLRTKVLKTNLV